MRITGEKVDGESLGRDVARSIHGAFASQAEQRPESVALVIDGRPISYGELDTLAKKLAGKLRLQTADNHSVGATILGVARRS